MLGHRRIFRCQCHQEQKSNLSTSVSLTVLVMHLAPIFDPSHVSGHAGSWAAGAYLSLLDYQMGVRLLLVLLRSLILAAEELSGFARHCAEIFAIVSARKAGSDFLFEGSTAEESSTRTGS